MNLTSALKIFVSALLNAAVTFGTAYLALLQGLQEGATIAPTALTIAFVGALLTAAKDVQAYLSTAPTIKK